MLASDRGLAEVEAKLAQAHALGISSVPTFVIDGKWAISGAQPPEAFAQALQQIAAEQGAPATRLTATRPAARTAARSDRLLKGDGGD